MPDTTEQTATRTIPVPEGIIEREFQAFLRASYSGETINSEQMLSLRCAFYGGALIGYGHSAEKNLPAEMRAHMRYVAAIAGEKEI